MEPGLRTIAPDGVLGPWVPPLGGVTGTGRGLNLAALVGC